MTDDNEIRSARGSGRSVTKTGALATTGLVLGAGTFAGTAAAQDDDDEVVVLGDDYRPDLDFDVVAQLAEETKDELIDNGGVADEFDDPDDWDAYLIDLDLTDDGPTFGFLLTEEADLEAGDSETMSEDATFRNAELNLIETTL